MGTSHWSIDEASRYTRQSILRSERVYGRGFHSPGGIAAVEALCRDFEEDEHQHLLDRWARKIEHCYRGELVWGSIVAHRPVA
jgi:hypothetical protein